MSKIISSPSQLDSEVQKILVLASQKESEETWKAYDNALCLLKTSVASIYSMDNFWSSIKKIVPFITASILSERSKLCGSACDLSIEIAAFSKQEFDSVASPIVNALLKLSMRANRVFVQRGTNTLETLISHAGLARIASMLAEGGKQQQNKTYRITVSGLVVCLLKHNDVDAILENLPHIEACIRDGLVDAESGVREKSREAFLEYQMILPLECARFSDTIPGSALKYVGVPSLSCSRPIVAEKEKDTSATLLKQRPFSTSVNTAKVLASVMASKGQDMQETVSASSQPKDRKAVATKMGTILAKAMNDKSSAFSRQTMPSRPMGSSTTPKRSKGLLGPVQRIDISEPTVKSKQVERKEEFYQSVPLANTEIEEPSKQSRLMPEKQEVNANTEKKQASLFRIPHPASREEEQTDAEQNGKSLNDHFNDAESLEWSVRVHAHEKIISHLISEPTTPSLKQILDLMLGSLEDSHFRVLMVVVDAWNTIFDIVIKENSENYNEPLIPGLLNIAESPQYKNKGAIRETSQKLLKRIETEISSLNYCTVLFDILNNPKYSNCARVRHGAIAHLARVTPSIKGEFFNKVSTFRMALSRLSGSILEADKLVLNNITKIILEMNKASQSMFFEAVSYLSLTDKTRIRGIASKHIKDFKRHEDHANIAKRSKSKTATSLAKSAVPLNSRLPIKSEMSVSRALPVQLIRQEVAQEGRSSPNVSGHNSPAASDGGFSLLVEVGSTGDRNSTETNISIEGDGEEVSGPIEHQHVEQHAPLSEADLADAISKAVLDEDLNDSSSSIETVLLCEPDNAEVLADDTTESALHVVDEHDPQNSPEEPVLSGNAENSICDSGILPLEVLKEHDAPEDPLTFVQSDEGLVLVKTQQDESEVHSVATSIEHDPRNSPADPFAVINLTPLDASEDSRFIVEKQPNVGIEDIVKAFEDFETNTEVKSFESKNAIIDDSDCVAPAAVDVSIDLADSSYRQPDESIDLVEEALDGDQPEFDEVLTSALDSDYDEADLDNELQILGSQIESEWLLPHGTEETTVEQLYVPPVVSRDEDNVSSFESTIVTENEELIAPRKMDDNIISKKGKSTSVNDEAVRPDEFLFDISSAWEFIDSCIKQAVILSERKLDVSNVGALMKNIQQNSFETRHQLLKMASELYKIDSGYYEAEFLGHLSDAILDIEEEETQKEISFVLANDFSEAGLPFAIHFH